MRFVSFTIFLLGFLACTTEPITKEEKQLPDQFLVVLGIAQDAGYPQANCYKDCCKEVEKPELVSCLGIVDQNEQKIWLLDATPDFKEQLKHLQSFLQDPHQLPAGILLTHAHMGHYTGLVDLGREAIGSNSVPVYGMPRMNEYLTNNGPWSQLVSLNNIALEEMQHEQSIQLSKTLSITPFLVPHRDEFSETVGFKVEGPNASALFIPDIDKWDKWDKNIVDEVKKVDYAFLDATFYQNGEIPNRDMSEIPHPFVEETIALFSEQPDSILEKVIFIHLNHTNPLLQKGSKAIQDLDSSLFQLAQSGITMGL